MRGFHGAAATSCACASAKACCGAWLANRRRVEEPWPNLEAEGLDLVAPHIDGHRLLERKREHGDAVVEQCGAHLKARLTQ
jgi:hypothetical protein